MVYERLSTGDDGDHVATFGMFRNNGFAYSPYYIVITLIDYTNYLLSNAQPYILFRVDPAVFVNAYVSLLFYNSNIMQQCVALDSRIISVGYSLLVNLGCFMLCSHKKELI